VPIIAGIMPITSLGGMKRMAQLALDARFPAKLVRALALASDDPEAVKRVGVIGQRSSAGTCWTTIYFYTLNKSDEPLETILERPNGNPVYEAISTRHPERMGIQHGLKAGGLISISQPA
jgi:5,10-methylenetetrahydrofolate reductase